MPEHLTYACVVEGVEWKVEIAADGWAELTSTHPTNGKRRFVMEPVAQGVSEELS